MKSPLTGKIFYSVEPIFPTSIASFLAMYYAKAQIDGTQIHVVVEKGGEAELRYIHRGQAIRRQKRETWLNNWPAREGRAIAFNIELRNNQ